MVGDDSKSPKSLDKRLPSLAIPTLIVYGSDDPLSLSEPRRLHALVARSTLVRIDRAGHFPWEEQPGAFFTPVGAFLNRRSGTH